jgi:hypothetical protein
MPIDMAKNDGYNSCVESRKVVPICFGSSLVKLPSRAQIARFLKQAGLTRRYQPPPTEPRTPHQEWQMDARWP